MVKGRREIRRINGNRKPLFSGFRGEGLFSRQRGLSYCFVAFETENEKVRLTFGSLRV